MIRTFRKQFIAIAMSAMAVSLVIMLLMINVFNYVMTMDELKTTLKLISDNNGIAPHSEESKRPFFPRLNPGVQYNGLYFSVLLNQSGKCIGVNLRQIDSMDHESAVLYAQRAADSEKEYGYAGDYLYYVSEKQQGWTRVSFLNWQSQRSSLLTFAVSSLLMGFLGLAATFLIVWRLSEKAVQPLIVSSAKQKQFITDASHELKTPLSVIAVNMDVLQMDIGENEWIESTQQQIRGLKKLVEQLVSITRIDEKETELEKKRFCLSDALHDTAAPFATVAAAQNKTFQLSVQEQVYMHGNEDLIRRLISVLCDNAVKYALEPGDIRIELTAGRKNCAISVSNRYQQADPNEDLSCMFDRFYRADASRNRDQQESGFGIGLSIAQKVVQWHQGNIQVYMKDESTICFQVSLPR